MAVSLDKVCDLADSAVNGIELKYLRSNPWKTLAYSVVAGYAIPKIYSTWKDTNWKHLYYNTEWRNLPWKKIGATKGYEVAMQVPILRGIVAAKVQQQLQPHERQFNQEVEDAIESAPIVALPDHGYGREVVQGLIPQGASAAAYDPAKVSGVFYGPTDDPELKALHDAMLSQFATQNPLHPELSPSLGEMERQLIRWCGNLFGLDRAYGCVTSGGTESLLLVAYSAFKAGKARGIQKPNIVMPITGHSAFNKASDYFGITIRTVPVTQEGKVEPWRMKVAMDHNTILVVASAPSYAYGIIDPVEEIAAIAQSADVPCHVDCCLGGFVLPWLKKDGDEQVPNFDFSIPGVTSMSADTHKFGYAPKGSSIILYREKEMYQRQIFTDPEWNGGKNTTPTFQGSRSGSPIATAWATMLYIGVDGYTDAAKNIAHATRELTRRCKETYTDSIEVIGDPITNVVAFRSNLEHWGAKDIWKVSTVMKRDHGWQLSALQNPPAFHMCITRRHASTREAADSFVDSFVADLSAAVEKVKTDPSIQIEGTAKAYGGTMELPPAIVTQALQSYMTAQTSHFKPSRP